MSRHTDDIKLKLAWQTAFELRTCPDGEMLHATEPDENLMKHLAMCHVCREKREMPQVERNAWKALRVKFSTISMKPGSGTEKQAGQVWIIKKEFGGWGEDDRFVRPPSVLLLEKIDGTTGWRVAQLFNDKRMMGADDVALGDQFGFAEAWNCYALKDDRFEKCLGGVQSGELGQVIAASTSVHDPTPEGSVLSFFRSMEIEVGAFVAVPAVGELVEEWDAEAHPVSVNKWLEDVLGVFSDVKGQLIESLVNWRMPETATSFFEYLAGASPMQGAPLMAANAGVVRMVNLVPGKSGSILLKPLAVTITNDDVLDDGTYFIAGKFSEACNSTMHLLAKLETDKVVIAESQSQVNPDSFYFTIIFANVPIDACVLDNVKMLLVSL